MWKYYASSTCAPASNLRNLGTGPILVDDTSQLQPGVCFRVHSFTCNHICMLNFVCLCFFVVLFFLLFNMYVPCKYVVSSPYLEEIKGIIIILNLVPTKV